MRKMSMDCEESIYNNTEVQPLEEQTAGPVGKGQAVRISFNNNQVASAELPGTRLFGFANLFVAERRSPQCIVRQVILRLSCTWCELMDGFD